MKRWLAVWATVCSFSAIASSADREPVNHVEQVRAGTALFQKSVRAVLVKECLHCHGGKQTKGDFDLTTREKLLESGMVEKTAATSRLVSLIRQSEEPHMPFKGDKLSADQIAAIEKWIDLGAHYDRPLVDGATGAKSREVTAEDRRFWSFAPLTKPPVPAVADAWCRTEIDRFIRAAQAEKGLHPNPPIDRRRLGRRLYFDLIGLPPTAAELESFANDRDPQADEKLIDRLLESPRFGERWARHWMDVARFGESHGYEQDYDRQNAWPYRDFLIHAFNSDMPYNQFVQWQLAGDELAPHDPQALAATGFMGAGVFPTQLTETEFESARYDELDDMTATTGVAFLGLSIGCARCHDHKFDPIQAKDYYQMAAAFSRTIRSEIDVDTNPEENARRRSEFAGQVAQKQTEIQELQARSNARFRRFLETYDPAQTPLTPWEYLDADTTTVTGSGGSVYQKLPDGSFLATGKAPATETITVTAVVTRPRIVALRVEALAHDSLPSKGPGRAGNGNFVLSSITAQVVAPVKPGEVVPPITLKFATAQATHQQNADSLSVNASLDPDPNTGWAVDMGGIGKDNAAVFTLEAPVLLPSGSQLTVTLVCAHPNPQHGLGHFRLSVAAPIVTAGSTVAWKPPVEVGRTTLDVKVGEALAALKQNYVEDSPAAKVGQAWFAENDVDLQALRKQLADLQKAGAKLLLTKTQISTEGMPHLPHHADDRGYPHFYPETHLLTRGDVNQKGEVAQPGYPGVLRPEGTTSEHWKQTPPADWTRTTFRRAGLANWITDPQQGGGGLAARATAPPSLRPIPMELGESLRDIGDPELRTVLESLARSMGAQDSNGTN